MNQEPMRILLAEDDVDDRRFFKEAIESTKVRTSLTTVNDGEQLMKHLREPGVLLPNLLFLDLNMPRKGGVECLREIKKDPSLRDLCVAIYSTSSSEEDIENTFVMGASVYIRKPNDFNSLRKILSEVISINWQFHSSGLNRENFLLRM